MLIASLAEDMRTLVLQRYSEETGTAALLGDEQIRVEVKRDMASLLMSLKQVAIAEGCIGIISVATEAFRNCKDRTLVCALERIVGPIRILDSTTEGQIFYQGMSQTLDLSDNIAVVDVGGGSVQVVWGPEATCNVSLPTGTFYLQAQFQASNSISSLKEYDRMRTYIMDCMQRQLPSGLYRERLVFGSNCMQSFISSALSACDEHPIKGNGIVEVGIEELSGLMSRIQGIPYDDVGHYFPENPRFMYGADKALLNILAIGERLKASILIPTNESVSTSLARCALTDPSTLQPYNVTLQDL